jgi:hypothetical protein
MSVCVDPSTTEDVGLGEDGATDATAADRDARDATDAAAIDSTSTIDAETSTDSVADVVVDVATDSGSDECDPATAPTSALFVGSRGSDATGTGSPSKPFQTITHALEVAVLAPSTSWTICLTNDAGSSTRFGVGCTASSSGGVCDVTPIAISSLFSGGIAIVGPAHGPASAIVVVGGKSIADREVFLARAPAVGFRHMTITPTSRASSGGANGIHINAPAATLGREGEITDVEIDGTSVLDFSVDGTATGNAIVVEGGASPTIGPALVISGGWQGILVTNELVAAGGGASHPTIVSAAGAATRFTRVIGSAIRVETNGASSGPPPTLTIRSSDPATPVSIIECSDGVVVDEAIAATPPVSIANVAIGIVSDGRSNFGIHLLSSSSATISNTSIVQAGMGIVAEGSSTLAITGGVSSKINRTGVHITGKALADIDGLTANTNAGAIPPDGNGLWCDSTGTGTSGFTIKM